MSKLATQGMQNLFSLHQSGPQSGPHWEANSEGHGIIGGLKGCRHFRRLHLNLVSEMARIPSESGLFYALNCSRVKGKSLDYHLLFYRAIIVNVKQ